MKTKNLEVNYCVICKKIYYTRSKSTQKCKSIPRVRPIHALTCSKECSRKLTASRKNYPVESTCPICHGKKYKYSRRCIKCLRKNKRSQLTRLRWKTKIKKQEEK